MEHTGDDVGTLIGAIGGILLGTYFAFWVGNLLHSLNDKKAEKDKEEDCHIKVSPYKYDKLISHKPPRYK